MRNADGAGGTDSRAARGLLGPAHRRGQSSHCEEVNRLIKDFEQAKLMMKALKKGPKGLAGLRGRMR